MQGQQSSGLVNNHIGACSFFDGKHGAPNDNLVRQLSFHAPLPAPAGRQRRHTRCARHGHLVTKHQYANRRTRCSSCRLFQEWSFAPQMASA